VLFLLCHSGSRPETSIGKFDSAILATVGRCSLVAICIGESIIGLAGTVFGEGSHEARDEFSDERFKGGDGRANQTYVNLYGCPNVDVP